MISRRKKPRLKLWQKVVIGMILGLVFGYYVKTQEASGSELFLKMNLLDKVSIVGTLYMNMLKMIVVPVIFFAILFGITSIDDVSSFGRIGVKALILYTSATIVAVCIGIGFGLMFKPGIGVDIPMISATETRPPIASQKLGDILMSVIPTNPAQAMASGNTLQIVVFSFFIGISLILIGDKGREARGAITSFTHAVFKMVELVIKTTPFGVFAIMAKVMGQYGFDVMVSLGKLGLAVTGAFAIQYALFAVMLMLAGVNPIPFFKKMLTTQALAFATSSTKATLSTALFDIQHRMGVSKKVSSFVLPLGAAINMSATAIYLGITALFFAQLSGNELSLNQYIIIIIASTIGSIGAAGFPGGGVIMMGMVFSSAGIPIDGIPLIMGIDRFLDMVRTVINITGDCVITLIVDKYEKTWDAKKYMDMSIKTRRK